MNKSLHHEYKLLVVETYCMMQEDLLYKDEKVLLSYFDRMVPVLFSNDDGSGKGRQCACCQLL